MHLHKKISLKSALKFLNKDKFSYIQLDDNIYGTVLCKNTYNKLFDKNKAIVIDVFELSRYTLPYIKKADYCIFRSNEQYEFCKEYDYLPNNFTVTKPVSKKSKKKSDIVITNDTTLINSDCDTLYVHATDIQSLQNQVSNIKVKFNNLIIEHGKGFEKLFKLGCQNNVVLTKNKQIKRIWRDDESDCYLADVFNPKYNSDDKLFKYISKHVIKEPKSFDYGETNIIYGKPEINSKYTFIVNFRNQESKLKRCIYSIRDIKNIKNYHIIVTDDMSTDGSVDLLQSLSGYDMTIISNKERKYASKNLACATKLIKNPESIIIELDGDDYMDDFDGELLSTLDGIYETGILTTHGNYKTIPEWSEMDLNQLKTDWRFPWNQGMCASWLPMRTYKSKLINMVEDDYFFENNSNTLKFAHDVSINSRMIELADGKVETIKKPYYIYDTSGNDHDVTTEWSPLPAHKALFNVVTFE